MIHYYFPEVFQQLNQELQYHPELQKLMHETNLDNPDPTTRFAVVASYCQVILNDTYTDQDLEKIAHILLTRLREKRTMLILPLAESTPKQILQ